MILKNSFTVSRSRHNPGALHFRSWSDDAPKWSFRWERTGFRWFERSYRVQSCCSLPQESNRRLLCWTWKIKWVKQLWGLISETEIFPRSVRSRVWRVVGLSGWGALKEHCKEKLHDRIRARWRFEDNSAKTKRRTEINHQNEVSGGHGK